MFRIRKLDLFIARQFLLLFVATFFVCLFVLMMQFLWRYVDTLIGKGLSVDVLGQFFWYMSLMLIPQALPLAILLSSLITFGNMGESSELTAIKAAGISLMQTFRPLVVITLVIMAGSFYFQNVVGPNANMSFAQLLLSMKQKSPEMEIPEGVFYDGIPKTNIYVQRKNPQTGMLYGLMIYRLTDSFEDAAIILADSGMMQSTAEKKHLMLTLYSGEWFENMKNSEVAGSASVPYRRETFTKKRIVQDFDTDFNLTDASLLANDARGKSLDQIRHDIDSLKLEYDSIGRNFYSDAMRGYFRQSKIGKADSARAARMAATKTFQIDTVYARMEAAQKQRAISSALHRAQASSQDADFKGLMTSEGDRLIRQHRIEAIGKFTLALSCLLFFFIGAPLGTIIRKGGLGIPVIISVLVFIVYYIFDNTGYRMARGGMWAVWFGKGIATAVLTPLAVFFTYKANNDSVVFNMDLYRNLLMRLLGLRLKRHVFAKEVVIEDPDYDRDAAALADISARTEAYERDHRLLRLPNFVSVFFRYEPDHEIERLCDDMEKVIDDLSNTRDPLILTELNHYPVVSAKAHTRPFERPWLNVASALLVPVGLFLYARMWFFRLRLRRDLRTIRQTNDAIAAQIALMGEARHSH